MYVIEKGRHRKGHSKDENFYSNKQIKITNKQKMKKRYAEEVTWEK